VSPIRRLRHRAARVELAPRPTLAGALTAALALGLGIPSTAPAVPAGPHWSIVSQSEPTYFKPGDTNDAYRLIVRNDGSLPTAHASTVTIADTLPAGVTATKVSARGQGPNGSASPAYSLVCSQAPIPRPVTCTYSEGEEEGTVLPGATIVMTITVSVAESAASLAPNVATVSGGGAPSAATSETTTIDREPVPFGLSYFNVDLLSQSGEADTQAGSHPYELTASLGFNISGREEPPSGESPLANAAPRDLEVQLPPGLIGDPNAVPRCSQRAFLEREKLACPLDTQVGTVKPLFYGRFASAVFPLYDLVPPPAEPAELGFAIAHVGHVPIFLNLRNRRGYGLAASLDQIPETGPFQGAILTLWGVPAAASHDLEREGTRGEGSQEGEVCQPTVKVIGGAEEQQPCPSGAPARPFLTLPSQCQSPGLGLGVEYDSWQHPVRERFLQEPALAQAITGCELLSFSPSLLLAPETTQAGAPSGYTIDVRMPQSEEPGALATPALRNAVVRLPAGVVLSPSAANGLQDCTPQQFEPPGAEPGSSRPAECPSQSRIGAVKIATPLLASPLEGDVFLGAPECAPCSPAAAQEGKLLRLLIQARQASATVKLEGAVSIDQATGALTASFDDLPELPLEDVQLTLAGGQNAPLANPPGPCGAALAAASQLTPYSSETPAEPSSEPFALSGCAQPTFAPSFVAGTTNNQAGAASPLTVTLSRSDQDEDLRRLSVRLAPGLLATLAKVVPCPEARAQAGSCEPQSRVGSVVVGAGPGPNPLFLEGSVYLTGPYQGAPFGLAIVVPVLAGPLDLGTIDLRARIEVSPSTAALTIASDPLPQSLDGIPLALKTIHLDVDREGFVVNPTNCRALAIEGVLDSSVGATATVSSRFQAANCATLPFKPRLSGLTHAKTSKADGAYLHMRLESAPGQANIAKLKVDVPRQLPVRLTTLQNACTVAVLQANPASCPAASVVGSVTVITPVLRHALVGPVYLVSHGGAQTPDLEFVLQGEGVTVDVVGQTIIGHGVISAVFRSLPDVPISRLGLVLSPGPHSLLAANLPAKAKRSLCGQSLAMATAITAQNGAVVKQTTKISVLGCPRRKASKHSASKRKA